MVGDFNAITSEQEKVGGNPILNTNSQNFKRFISNVGLTDLGYKGAAYTWTNRPNASKAIFERLDRVVATTLWLNKYAGGKCASFTKDT